MLDADDVLRRTLTESASFSGSKDNNMLDQKDMLDALRLECKKNGLIETSRPDQIAFQRSTGFEFNMRNWYIGVCEFVRRIEKGDCGRYFDLRVRLDGDRVIITSSRGRIKAGGGVCLRKPLKPQIHAEVKIQGTWHHLERVEVEDDPEIAEMLFSQQRVLPSDTTFLTDVAGCHGMKHSWMSSSDIRSLEEHLNDLVRDWYFYYQRFEERVPSYAEDYRFVYWLGEDT